VLSQNSLHNAFHYTLELALHYSGLGVWRPTKTSPSVSKVYSIECESPVLQDMRIWCDMEQTAFCRKNVILVYKGLCNMSTFSFLITHSYVSTT
jgi:hypothetical protein